MLRSIRNPDLYHGHNKHGVFFEGWYFKVVDRTGTHRFAFIPGIYKGKDSKSSHSFLQVIDGSTPSYHYHTYPQEVFTAHKKEFRIAVGDNCFSGEGFSLQHDNGGQEIAGEIRLHNRVKWPDTWYRPGSMGYYNFLTFMQCYSQVCCLHADITGTLRINGRQIDFTGGTAYIEKNWGRDFPYGWVWIQANNFSSNTASISCSIGHIPFLSGSFRGHLIGLYANDRFYPFTTMGKSTLRIEKDGYTCHIFSENKTHTLQVTSFAGPDTFVLCCGPRDESMQPLVDESLSGSVDVVLTEKSTGMTVFADSSHSGGIEYGGNQSLILSEK